nr:DEAD-box ATP-dependent RNA helicase 13 [Tanacetum cinerariifolium]
DVISAAETGSGKTQAFRLPLLQRLLEEREEFERHVEEKGEADAKVISKGDEVLCTVTTFILSSLMSSPHKRLPKPSKVAKISVRPIWRKKLNYCYTSNEVDVNLPSPMPKPQSPLEEPSQENPPTTHSNHELLQSLSLLLGDTNVTQALISPQSVNQTQLTQPLFPHLLINQHVASVLNAQTPSSPQGDNQNQPSPPPSPSREILINDINQLQDLSNLLAMHLS